MDINFNGTIITLFGCLPLETLGSQGGAGSGPSSLDVCYSSESAGLAMRTQHSVGEKEGVMEKWGTRKVLLLPNILNLRVPHLLTSEFSSPLPLLPNW